MNLLRSSKKKVVASMVKLYQQMSEDGKGLRELVRGLPRRKGKVWKTRGRAGWLEVNLGLVRRLEDD